MAIIVGDIHGCVEKVRAFLTYKPEEDHIALGDYLDSFIEPQVRQIEALQLLLDSKAILLWGNHDLHYLKTPPFLCTGFQHGREKPLQKMIEANKKRFVAAHVADGWLCTHGGVASWLAEGKTDAHALAKKFNNDMALFLENPGTNTEGVFAIGKARGGSGLGGGIFWFDHVRERDFLAAGIKQILGHTECKEPFMVANTYIALDTTNNRHYCWLFDTAINELVRLDLPKEYRWPRLRNLPPEEQKPFWEWMIGRTLPYVEGVPREEQDFFYPWDYRDWKSRAQTQR